MSKPYAIRSDWIWIGGQTAPHYGVSDLSQALHVTVPFARPIKRVYIRQLVRFVDAVRIAREKGA